MIIFAEFIKETDHPIVIADDNGIISSVNSKFEKIFSWNANDILGHPLTKIIPKTLKDAHNLGFSKYSLSGSSDLLNKPLDLEILTGKGEIVLAEHFILAGEKEGRTCFATRITLRQHK